MSNKRLDEILLEKGLLTPEQIGIALNLQKKDGGLFGSQLLKLKYITEKGLVSALCKQMGCRGVLLEKIEVQPLVLKLIPQQLVWARKIFPFMYDAEKKLLKVACENPLDKNLIKELDYVASGFSVKLYAAAELYLSKAIAENYEMPEVIPDVDQSTSAHLDITGVTSGRRNILLICDDIITVGMIKPLIEKSKYFVKVTDTIDNALGVIESYKFTSVFISNSVPGDPIYLLDRLRKLSPSTQTTFFDTPASLMLEDSVHPLQLNLMTKNLELITALLSENETNKEIGKNRLGYFAEKLSRRMKIPFRDRLNIISAAYIYDIVGRKYESENKDDPRKVVEQTLKLLQSINYSPVVISILRKMYVDLRNKYNERLPLEILGGNILTASDMICKELDSEGNLSWDRFEYICKDLDLKINSTMLREVVKSVRPMLEKEIYYDLPDCEQAQIMIYNAASSNVSPIELRLKNEGFRTLSTPNIAELCGLYRRSRPDVMILIPSADSSEIESIINYMNEQGVEFNSVPTYMLVENDLVKSMRELLDKNIEDILSLDGNLELLIMKLKKVYDKNNPEADLPVTEEPKEPTLKDLI